MRPIQPVGKTINLVGQVVRIPVTARLYTKDDCGEYVSVPYSNFIHIDTSNSLVLVCEDSDFVHGYGKKIFGYHMGLKINVQVQRLHPSEIEPIS